MRREARAEKRIKDEAAQAEMVETRAKKEIKSLPISKASRKWLLERLGRSSSVSRSA